MSAEKTYLSAAETAKLVRKALKADFPGVKFSVRSSTYAGGASISVRWIDGPTSKTVDRTLGRYEGASFDPMIDLKSYHDTLLMTDEGPVNVHLGADYVHANRQVSEFRLKLYERELRRFLAGMGVEWVGREARYPVSCHDAYGDDDLPGELSQDSHQGDWGSSIIQRMAWFRPWKGERCPSGEGAYCPGCGRYQHNHKAPHNR